MSTARTNFADWLQPVLELVKVGREKSEAFSRLYAKKPESGAARAAYLKSKWQHLNDPHVEFFRLVSGEAVPAQARLFSDESVYLPRAVTQFHEAIGAFGGSHKWMPFSVLGREAMLQFRMNEDLGALEELGENEVAKYRMFATFGFLGRSNLMIRLAATRRDDDLVLSFDYESRVARVVAAGFADLVRGVSFCANADIKMDLLSPRGRFRSWLFEQDPASPPECYRRDGTKFSFERLGGLSKELRVQLFR